MSDNLPRMTRGGARRRTQRASLSGEVRQQLQAELTDGTYAIGERLPSEPDLAETYAVSRATLREILSVLERDGLVRRVHGVGTFVTAPDKRLRSALNSDVGVTEGLSASDVSTEVRLVQLAEQQIPGWLAATLHVSEGSMGLRIERVVRVDDQPAVHVVDVIPNSVIEAAGSPVYAGGSVYAFLEGECGIQLSGGVVDIAPVVPSAQLARHLNCARGIPLLRLEQVEHDTGGRPVLFAQEHYLPGVITLTVNRERNRALSGLLTST